MRLTEAERQCVTEADQLGYTAMIVYFRMSDHSDSDGVLDARIGELEEKLRLRNGAITKAVRTLEAHGLVEIQRRWKRPTRYVLKRPSGR